MPDTSLTIEPASAPEVQQSAEDERTARDLAVVDALDRGVSYREICKTHGIAIGTVANIAERYAQFNEGAVSKLMQAKSLRMLAHWERAAETGAEFGKHAAAKEWLTHSLALKPVQSDSGSGAKVAVIIGVPGSPLDQPTTQVIVSQQDTDK